MTLPTYEENPFFAPKSVEEAAELAQDHMAHGVDPRHVSGAYGSYCDLSADLPWVDGGFAPVADLSAVSAGPTDLARTKGDVVEWGDDSGAKAYGVILELDLTLQQATVQPLSLDDNG
ncbi:MAG: hypothetical protein JO211_07335 [Acidobacteriaceae bacterium]|nr:hypothetical protein [Acidobacteriaceae bacterium]